MPKAFLNFEKKVEKSERKGGKSPQKARQIGFATATIRYGPQKRHHKIM